MMNLGAIKQRTKSSKASQARGGSIGTLGEKSLHSALKDWYAEPGDRLEAEVDGFHIDIVRRKLLIEIQTSNFSSQRKKLKTLIAKHRVRLVFPIAKEKWIVRLSGDGVKRLGRRKSPKRGHLLLLFEELGGCPRIDFCYDRPKIATACPARRNTATCPAGLRRYRKWQKIRGVMKTLTKL